MAGPTKERTKEERDALLRRILFVPCESKKQLHNWIKIFVGIDFPDSIVDPDSNCTPMEMIWETYTKARLNNDPSFSRVLYYASRDSYKSLGASVLELLVCLHLGRDVAHMAAIESQSRNVQRYIKRAMARPYLRDYLVGDNLEETWISRYNNAKTGENLNEAQFNALPESEKDSWIPIKNQIKVILCTMAGANSFHCPFMVVDELDVVPNPKAYDESKMIPAPINGIEPITLLTSTRKVSTGLVQAEIDNAIGPDGDVLLHIRHWNILDVTAACKPERHRPDLPKIPIYVNEKDLRAVSEEKFKDLNPDEQKQFTKEEGYAGCVKNCKLFAACKGRLATHQKSQSSLLKPINHVINMFTKSNLSVDTVLAQLLCRKPSTEGMIYPNLDKTIHMASAARIAEMIVGIPFPKTTTKADLIALAMARGLSFYSGMDFGFSHNFAVVTGIVDGQRLFIVDVISEPDLMPDEYIKKCDARIKGWRPSIYADTESPQHTALFYRSGYRMREWTKKPGSVEGGIEVVRMRLRPPMGDPLIYFLAGDAGCDLLVKRMAKYHWKVDAAGRKTNEPVKEDDDECDALRYLVMNVFDPKGGKVTSPNEVSTPAAPAGTDGTYTRENWVREWLQNNGVTETGDQVMTGKRGRFLFNI
jgi:hypothetical protein